MVKQLVTGLTLLVVSLGTAQAAPLYGSTYNLTDANAGVRGIWLNNGGISVGGASDHTFSVVSATFDGGTGTLSGSTHSATLGGGLDFSVALTHLCSSTLSDAGGSFVSVDNGACGLGNQRTGGAVSGVDVAGNTWDFWNYASPTFSLTGTGSLSEISLTISQKPSDLSKPFRFGIGADWDNKDLLGGSGWFNVDSWSSTCLPNGHPCPVVQANAGDFNLTAVVPEPPMFAIFALGLLAAGFSARRSKRS